MMEKRRCRRNILQTLNDSELMKRYRLDRAGIMFVVSLIRDALTPLTQRNNAITPEIKVITMLIYFDIRRPSCLCAAIYPLALDCNT